MPSVAFYISGHGFGHASREIEIINALGRRLPAGWRIVIRTAAARWLFDRTLTTPVVFLEGACDTGVIQIDSVRLDEEGTARAAADFYRTFDGRIAAEAKILLDHDVRLVVSDAPPLACAAAARAGVPSVVISNFTWDWIYSGYAEAFAAFAPGVIQAIATAYASAAAGWRLPMHGGFETISPLVDLPFVARHARHPRAEVRSICGLPLEAPIALLSFGGYGVRDVDLSRLDCLDDVTVLITHDGTFEGAVPRGVALLSEPHLYGSGLRYEDLVAAVDVVITKPGYGIISECVANRTALLYTSRGRFLEYEVLVREMPRFVRCGYIDHDDLFAGRWRDALTALLAAPPPPEQPRTDGAEVTARQLLQRC